MLVCTISRHCINCVLFYFSNVIFLSPNLKYFLGACVFIACIELLEP